MKLYTAFANQHSAECEAAIGVKASDGTARRAAYIYEQERRPELGIDMNPQRAFFDSQDNFIREGRGFPACIGRGIRLGGVLERGTITQHDRLVCCLNMEFYGPRWENVKRPMQLLGKLLCGSKQAAQTALACYLAHALEQCVWHMPVGCVAGLYGWAPLAERAPDEGRAFEMELERAVLLHATAYMPAPYVSAPRDWSFERRELDLVDMPRREVVPVVCGRCVYGDQPLVPSEAWAQVWERCAKWGATRAILWGDATAPDSVEFAKRINEAMRQGAKLAGVEIS